MRQRQIHQFRPPDPVYNRDNGSLNQHTHMDTDEPRLGSCVGLKVDFSLDNRPRLGPSSSVKWRQRCSVRIIRPTTRLCHARRWEKRKKAHIKSGTVLVYAVTSDPCRERQSCVVMWICSSPPPALLLSPSFFSILFSQLRSYFGGFVPSVMRMFSSAHENENQLNEMKRYLSTSFFSTMKMRLKPNKEYLLKRRNREVFDIFHHWVKPKW